LVFEFGGVGFFATSLFLNIESVSNPIERKYMTILAVDDDDDDLEFFQEVIASIDPTIRCVLARNCSEAHEILKHEIPDVLFLDINMPKENGLKCFDTIKQSERFKNLPVVFCSTAVNPVNIRYLLSSKVKFIPKEPIFKEAKASIGRVLKDLRLLPLKRVKIEEVGRNS
jgi:CheY-like chemotaxis protein